jgi:aspartyl-tRNA(Asn)/glutamyl-tRNA(Gln) amidotransferase subunit A
VTGPIADGELETAVEMAGALGGGHVSPRELVERALRRAEASQPVTNAFSQLWPEEAMSSTAGGLVSSPFAGIPIAVKDLYDARGHETTGCCRVYEGRVADHDAAAVAALRTQGLTLIGKTNQHELAYGGTNRYSSLGRTNNPWDPGRMTGGSSGGSAAAVAAGVVPWALGSDTGGSIRIPASLCGTFGLKPTTGRLSIDGMLPLAPSMDTPGPIASTAGDLRVLFLFLAGLDPATRGPASDPGRLRFGILGGYYGAPLHPAARDAVDATASVFASLGAAVERVDGTGIEDARRVWNVVTDDEFLAAHPALEGRWDLVLDPTTRGVPARVAGRQPGETAAARDRRTEIARWFRGRLEGFDALIVPTTGYPAPGHDQLAWDLGPSGSIEIERVGPGWFTCPVNLAGLPAVSLPAGRSSEGLPVGVSLIGAGGADERLLDLAVLWEEAASYRPQRSPILA